MTYKLITDATCDLPAQLAAEEDVTVLPMEYTLNSQPHTYCPGNSDIPLSRFFTEMRAGAPVATSQINTFTFSGIFEKYLANGMDVIYIAFSSGLSGMLASARTAAEELRAKYPQRKLAVVDSLCASLGQGLYVYYAARKRTELDFDGMVEWLNSHRFNFIHWFTVDDLDYLKRGGRISGTTAAIATVLKIKPVMHVDEEGHLIAVDKVQGRKKSLRALVDNMGETMLKDNIDVVFVGNCDCHDDAAWVAEQVRERYGIADVRIYDIGVMIGAHSGPGTVALFYYGSTRRP